MKQTKYALIVSVLILAFLAGCAANNLEAAATVTLPAPTGQPPAPTSTSIAPQPTLGSSPIPIIMLTPAPDLAAQVEQAKADLAIKLNVPAASIQVVEAGSVEWPDGSLGCPKPGIMYSQIVTPGTMIRLQYAGKIYEYHSGRSGQPFYCENPRGIVPQ